MFVMVYSFRHVRSKLETNDKGQKSMAFTFWDAIKRRGANLIDKELLDTYKRAGVTFNEQLCG
jgi:hypothetical protein